MELFIIEKWDEPLSSGYRCSECQKYSLAHSYRETENERLFIALFTLVALRAIYGVAAYTLPNNFGRIADMILELLFPTLEHEQEVWGYRQEHIEFGEECIYGSGGLVKADSYKGWLKRIEDLHYGPVPEGCVRSTTYLALVNEQLVGMVQVRYTLNEDLQRRGGNIGYGVRPFERRKGYGTKLLDLALDACGDVDAEEVLITCDKQNVASAKIITRNFGRLVKEIAEEDGTVVQHYQIRVYRYEEKELPEVAHLPRRYIYVIPETKS